VNTFPTPSNSNLEWKNLYQAEILETDWSKLPERIEALDSAIERRLSELPQKQGSSPEEIQAIQNALSGLTVLRKELKAWQGGELKR
jgi:hypothetical protein